MTVITKIDRSRGIQRVLDYSTICATADCGCPDGVFAGHATCGCKGCAGEKGDCHHAVVADKLVVSFGLDDGRAGTVTVAPTASDADIQAAIQAWSAKTRKAAPDPLLGRSV